MPWLSDDFRPARGLTNAHAQTMFGVLMRRATVWPRRERHELDDGDFIDLDVVAGDEGRPTVVVLHGLEGSSASGYMRVMLGALEARRWTGVALNFRSCSGVPNRKLASYSSGDFRDLAWLLARLRPRAERLFAVGFSLGASVLLNYLAQRGGEHLDAAAAVSAPYDLDACARSLDGDGRLSTLYLANFLLTMRRKALEKARRFGGVDPALIASAWSIRAFDAAFTAPSFGYASAEDYYARCSAGPQLSRITTPTLLISAEDDPLAPARHLPGDAHASQALDVLITRSGGHVGFVEGSVWRPRYWAEQRAMDWLAQRGRRATTS